jgi:hypothetical protein
MCNERESLEETKGGCMAKNNRRIFHFQESSQQRAISEEDDEIGLVNHCALREVSSLELNCDGVGGDKLLIAIDFE